VIKVLQNMISYKR